MDATIVLFTAAFRVSGVRGGAESPNITHALREDQSATLCGRTGWCNEEGQGPADDVCCLRCAAIARRAEEKP